MKLVAFDLDGTALNSEHEMSEKTKEVIKLAQSKGVIAVPATGRMRSFLPVFVEEISEIRYLITCNGAEVYDRHQGEIIYHQPLSNEKAIEVQTLLNEYLLYVEYYTDGYAVTKRGNPENTEKYGIPAERLYFTNKNYSFIDDYISFLQESKLTPDKVNMPYIIEEIYDEVRQRLGEISDISIISSIPQNLEINSSSSSKGDAVMQLARLLNIEPSEVVVIGDNENDLPMLTAFENSVAMGNAADEIKAKAKMITDTNDNDGVAKTILEFLN